MRRAALLLLACACSVEPSAPRAAALRVSTAQQLIGGPKALGQIGDYLLENDQIRVIIEDQGPGRSSTLYGGSLIDADLQRPEGSVSRGNDQMGELLPSFLMEVMNPVTVGITADGKDGGAAVVTETGTDGDLLQMVAILNNGLLYPPDLQFKEDFKLAPGKRYVELTTSITNMSTASHPLPFLNPQDLRGLGLDIPDLDKIQLSVPLGHLLLFGAENAAFTPGAGGFNLRFAIEDTYKTAKGFPAFPGMVTEWIATRAHGVSYGFMVPPSADNYPDAYRDLYEPAQPVTDHSLLIPYVYAAVTGVYSTNPPPILEAGATFSWTSYFIVGRGDVASVVDVMYEIRGVPTGVFAGRVLDVRGAAGLAGAQVVVQDSAGNYIDEMDTDANGAFLGHLPAGDYSYRIVTQVRDSTAAKHFTIAVGQITSVVDSLEPPAHVSVLVRDELGRPVPCKVALIGHFGAANEGRDPRDFLYDLHLGEHQRPTTFEPDRDEYIENSWYLPHGELSADVKPGTYDLAVSRGVEYDLHSEAGIVFSPGAFVSRQVALHRAIDTSGYVSADLHLHSVNSVDSQLSLEDRVISIAGEGLEFAAATDHNFITDYAPTIAALDLQDWLTSVVSLELTTFEMGHFNAYPLRVDPGNIRGGRFLWAGQTPDSLFKQLRDDLGFGRGNTLVEVNHPRDGVLGYFTQFNLDGETGDVVPRTGLRAVFAPFKPEFAPSSFSYDFDTLEVLNGKRMDLIHAFRAPDPLPPGPLPTPTPQPGEIVRDGDGHVAFPGEVDDWFTFLSRGQTYTAVGNSDSHTTITQEPGVPRSFIWVGAGNDVQGKFSAADVIAGLKSHRVIVTNAPMIDASIAGKPIGSTVTVTGPSATVNVRVTSANFAPVETVRVWSNGKVAYELAVPAAQAHDFSAAVDVPLARDAWFVVEAFGSANMFPVIPPQEWEPLNVDQVINALGAGLDLTGLSPSGSLKPKRTNTVTPYALTNPIWVDHDGNGRFDPPLPPVQLHPAAKPAGAPDVRAAFAAVPEVRP
jgi:hypothetical protein